MNTMKTGLTLATLLLCSAAQADFHFQRSQTDDVSGEDKQLADEITRFLKEYEEAYDNQDYRKVKSMWYDDGNPIYMAEEVPFPLYGTERLNNYFNPVPGKKILEGIDNTYSEVRAKYLTPDIAVATYRIDYDIKLMGMPATGGWDRIMSVFRKDDEGWKLTAYAEAPMGPQTMARKMMKAIPPETEEQKADYTTTRTTLKTLSQKSVRPGFDEHLAERADLEPKH